MSKEIVKPIPESPYLSPTTRQEKHAGSRHRRVVNGPSRRGFDGRARAAEEGRGAASSLSVQDARPTGNLSERGRAAAGVAVLVRPSVGGARAPRSDIGRTTHRALE